MAKTRKFPARAAATEASDDEPLSPHDGETIGDVIAKRYNRRDIMKGVLGVTAATALFRPAALAAPQTAAAADRFSFEEVT